MATIETYTIADGRTHRLRARTVGAGSLAARAAERAIETGQPAICVAHGGDVANAYGYPAETEAALVVALPPDRLGVARVGIWACQIPANKATLSGAAGNNLGVARALFDGRCNGASKAEARRATIRAAREAIGRAEAGEEGRRKARERAARRSSAPATTPAERLRRRRVAWLRSLGFGVSDAADVGLGDPAFFYRGGGAKTFVRWQRDDPPSRTTHRGPNGYVHSAVRLGRWVYYAGGNDTREPVAYLPFGDDRDGEAFVAEDNQERRRLIYAACGDRIMDRLAPELIQADDYGRLYRTAYGHAVRVACPSTGAEYWLPVPPHVRTAREAVAATFGLDAAEYRPLAEA